MIFTIDSSVYLSAFLSKDPYHLSSRGFLTGVERRKIDVVLPVGVPLEVANTLSRHGVPLKKAVQVFESFFTTPGTRILSIDGALIRTFMHEMHRFGLKTSDLIIAGTALYLNARLVTWDKKLIRMTKSRLETATPDKVFPPSL